ncbi:MAG TPA: hypothetical protein VLV15_05415 [Dongiaceae bacterium]|nr:hypothetical protein [Dongiaceae bacterium]
MMRCLNKQVQLNQEPTNYDLIAVNDAGLVLQRMPRAGAEHENVSHPSIRYVPWSSVLYYYMAGDFMDIVLVRE